jgi:hypothetical protein
MLENLSFVERLVVGVLPAILTLAGGWFIGSRIAHAWNLKQKKKEADIELRHQFFRLYGDFFATWKEWDRRLSFTAWNPGAEAEKYARELYARACKSEGELEAILVRLAVERRLGASEIAWLGTFRQVYQKLRQSIRDNENLGWPSSDDPDYLVFKRAAFVVSSLIETKKFPEPLEIARLLAVQDNRWENYWQEMPPPGAVACDLLEKFTQSLRAEERRLGTAAKERRS